MAEDLKKMYRTIVEDHFPTKMEVSFIDGDQRQTLFYEKVLMHCLLAMANRSSIVILLVIVVSVLTP